MILGVHDSAYDAWKFIIAIAATKNWLQCGTSGRTKSESES